MRDEAVLLRIPAVRMCESNWANLLSLASIDFGENRFLVMVVLARSTNGLRRNESRRALETAIDFSLAVSFHKFPPIDYLILEMDGSGALSFTSSALPCETPLSLWAVLFRFSNSA